MKSKVELIRRFTYEKRGYVVTAEIMRHENQDDWAARLYGKDKYRISVVRILNQDANGFYDFTSAGITALTTENRELANSMWVKIVNGNLTFEDIEKVFENEEEND